MSLTAAALVGAIAGGVWSLDGRFAKAEDVKEQLQGVRNDLSKVFIRSERRALESEKRQLTREQFDLVAIQEKRRLTDLELKRLQSVTEDIGKLEAEIKALTEKERDTERKK